MKKRKNRSRVKFRLKGLNQENLINKLIKSVNVYNFKREEQDICEFEIDFAKEKVVANLLKDEKIEILTTSRFGFLEKIKRFTSSFGIIIAIVFCSLIYTFQYSYVWGIEINGNVNVDERIIERYVSGILPSKRKSQIDTKKLEQKIKENFKEISSISIAILGQTLVLNVNEASLPEEMNGEFKPLLSDFDGLVTEINLIQGTLAINEGEIVRKGDVLVYPYIIDSQGEDRAVAPKAEIYADVWICEKYMHYDYQIEVKRTGRIKSISEVYLNNLLIYSNRKDIKFSEFEIETQEIPLTYNLIIPFKLKKTYYYETEIIERYQKFDDVKDKIIEATRKKTLIFVQENEIIKEENFTIREEGGCHEINYVVTVNRNIGG